MIEILICEGKSKILKLYVIAFVAGVTVISSDSESSGVA